MKGGISLGAGNRQRNCNRRLPMGRQNRSSGVKAVLMPAISAANDCLAAGGGRGGSASAICPLTITLTIAGIGKPDPLETCGYGPRVKTVLN